MSHGFHSNKFAESVVRSLWSSCSATADPAAECWHQKFHSCDAKRRRNHSITWWMLLDLIDYITCFCGWFQYAQKMGMGFFQWGPQLPMKWNHFFLGEFSIIQLDQLDQLWLGHGISWIQWLGAILGLFHVDGNGILHWSSRGLPFFLWT